MKIKKASEAPYPGPRIRSEAFTSAESKAITRKPPTCKPSPHIRDDLNLALTPFIFLNWDKFNQYHYNIEKNGKIMEKKHGVNHQKIGNRATNEEEPIKDDYINNVK